MDTFQWVTFGITVGGFLFTIGGGLVGGVKAIEKIKADTAEKITSETLARTRALADAVSARTTEIEKLHKEWADSQRSQDDVVRELGLSLRRYIEGVEKEMHKIEIWGRDNYVQKPELDSVRMAIRELGANIQASLMETKKDLKEDIRELREAIPK